MANYYRVHHNGSDSFIDYNRKFYIRNSGSTWIMKVDTDNQTYLYYSFNASGITNSTNAITNNSTLSQVGSATFTGGITNNGTLTQNSNANINSDLYVSGGISFACNASIPTASTGGSRGLGIYWNVNPGQGETLYLNYAQRGAGGHTWYYANAARAPTSLMKLDSSKILSLINNVSCVSINTSGAITNNSTLSQVGTSSYTGDASFNGATNFIQSPALIYGATLPTLTQTKIGYKISKSYGTGTYSSGWNSLAGFTLPVGYWLVMNNIIVTPSGSTTYNFGLGLTTTSIIDQYNLIFTSSNQQTHSMMYYYTCIIKYELFFKKMNYYTCTTATTLYPNLYISASTSVNYAYIQLVRIA